MSRQLRQFRQLSEQTNARLAELQEEARPRITVDESADLRVKSFNPLRTVSFGSDFPWLKGAFRVDALEAKSGTEIDAVRIAAIVPVEETWYSKVGYMGVFLEGNSAHTIMSHVLGIEIPEIHDVPYIEHY